MAKKKLAKTKPHSKSSKLIKKKATHGGLRKGSGAPKKLPGDFSTHALDLRLPLNDAISECGITNRTRYINKLIAQDLLKNHKLSDKNIRAIQLLLLAIEGSN